VVKLEPEGLTVTEIAPGIDLERDVLGQAEIPLRVSAGLRTMDERIFFPDRMRLNLGQSRRSIVE
jgi:propionate CoA-transferase